MSRRESSPIWQQPGHAAASDASGKVENTDYHDDLVCVAFRWN